MERKKKKGRKKKKESKIAGLQLHLLAFQTIS